MAKRPLEFSRLLLAGVAAGAVVVGVSSALAQFAPPRPPANVPSARPMTPQSSAPLGLPEQMPPEEMDEEAQPPVPPVRGAPPSAGRPGVAVAPPGGVSSQPLAPPPGGAVAPPGVPGQPGAPPTQAAVPPAGQRLQGPRGQQPAPAAPQDEIVTEMPSQKINNPTAIFAGLDKITGRIIAFDVALNEKVQFGALQVTPRVCYTRPPTETANTDAFVEVDEVTLQGDVKRLFGGWMFAASPGINAVEHPIYDVWLTDCKGGAAPDAQANATPSATPASASPRPARPATPSAGTAPRPQTPRPAQPQGAPPAVPPPFR